MKPKNALPVLLGVAALLAGCSTSASHTSASTAAGAGPAGAGSVVVGSGDFPESEILADIYADAMSAKGVKVTKKLNIGERPVYMQALKDHSIDFVPEYSGSILDYLDPKATVKTPNAVYAALRSEAGSSGLAALPYAPAQDSDTITVTSKTAAKYHLTSIADLAAVAHSLTLGAPAQFKTRADGIPALKSVYQVEFGTFTPLNASGTITVNSLKNGSIDAGDIFSTDPEIAKNSLVPLRDPKNMFAAQNIVPLAASNKLSRTATTAVDAVSAKLDTSTLAKLVAEQQAGKDPNSVAKAWLAVQGLG